MSAYNEAEFRWLDERARATGDGAQHERWHAWREWNGTGAGGAPAFSPFLQLPPVGSRARARAFVETLLRLDWIGSETDGAPERTVLDRLSSRVREVERAVLREPQMERMIRGTMEGAGGGRGDVEEYILGHRQHTHPSWRIAPGWRAHAATYRRRKVSLRCSEFIGDL